MARKRPTFSFPELEAKGRGAILRSPDEVRAEEEMLENRGEMPPQKEAAVASSQQVGKPTSGQVVKTTSGQAVKTTNRQVAATTTPQDNKATRPRVEKYTTHLKPETIKAIKRVAFESERKDYEVVQEALDAYLRRIKQ